MTITEHPLTIAMPLRMTDMGVIRIGNSRISLETLIDYYKQGASPEDLARKFDVLSLAEIYHVIAYYLDHTEEVEQYMKQAEARAQEIQAKVEALHEQTGFAEKLREIRARIKTKES